MVRFSLCGVRPVGSGSAIPLMVLSSGVSAKGRNMREEKQNALSHAEIEAINCACKKLGSWRLDGCEMYVTLEPCPMCAGAIINSRIKNVYFGASDYKNGACGSVINLFELDFNHKPNFESGILETECSEILTRFFKNLREKKAGN
mgnify:CR=1 FL=1